MKRTGSAMTVKVTLSVVLSPPAAELGAHVTVTDFCALMAAAVPMVTLTAVAVEMLLATVTLGMTVVSLGVQVMVTAAVGAELALIVTVPPAVSACASMRTT